VHVRHKGCVEPSQLRKVISVEPRKGIWQTNHVITTKHLVTPTNKRCLHLPEAVGTDPEGLVALLPQHWLAAWGDEAQGQEDVNEGCGHAVREVNERQAQQHVAPVEPVQQQYGCSVRCLTDAALLAGNGAASYCCLWGKTQGADSRTIDIAM